MITIRILTGMVAGALLLRGQNPDPRAQARAEAEKTREAARQATKEAIKNRFGGNFGDGVQEIVKGAMEQAFSYGYSLDGNYQSGQRALDRKDYDRAIQQFDQVIAQKSARADGAMYWKAYAQHRSGKRDQALATLADLEKQFPQSRWLNDARALSVEARAGSPSAEAQTDEDLKLLALNGLIHQDPDRAIPMLEKILSEGKSTPALKRQALFVLARSRAPRASELLTQYAKGGSNPDLQAKAIEYLGTARSTENTQTLANLYPASDTATKKEVIRALRRQDAGKQLVELAKKESDPALKKDIVRELSAMKSKEASDYLMELLSK